MFKVISTVFAILIFTTTAWGQETVDKVEPVSLQANNPNSSVTVDHDLINVILKGLVFKGEWIVEAAKNTPPKLGTRIRTVDSMQKGQDVNFIPYKLVTTKYGQFITTLNYYISDMQDINVSSLNRKEQLAYWLNVRNALVLSTIFNNYPIKGKKLKELITGQEWTRPVFKMQNYSLSIRDIETLITTTWQDPRVLYGFFYGAKQGPFIMNEAFLGATVYEQLENNARTYLNASKTISVSTRRGVKLPEPFRWHASLFENNEAGVLGHIKTYADKSLLKKLNKVSSPAISYDLDWKLNDLPVFLSRQVNDMFFAFLNGGECLGVTSSEGCNAGARIDANAWHSEILNRHN